MKEKNRQNKKITDTIGVFGAENRNRIQRIFARFFVLR